MCVVDGEALPSRLLPPSPVLSCTCPTWWSGSSQNRCHQSPRGDRRNRRGWQLVAPRTSSAGLGSSTWTAWEGDWLTVLPLAHCARSSVSLRRAEVSR